MMLIGREELLHHHERDLERARAHRAAVRLAKLARRDRRTVLRLAKLARQERRAAAVGRQESSGSGRRVAGRPADMADAVERPR
jgi:hypothetical protein